MSEDDIYAELRELGKAIEQEIQEREKLERQVEKLERHLQFMAAALGPQLMQYTMMSAGGLMNPGEP